MYTIKFEIMSVSEINSILYLHLTATSGAIIITNEIPVQRCVVKQYNITWASTGAATTAGGVLLFDIQPFTSSVINTNVTAVSGAIPLFNKSAELSTCETVEIPLDLDRNVQQAFNYRIVLPSGVEPANFTSLDLIISYASGSRF